MTVHRKEAEETLREEHCTHEWLRIFQIGEDWYAAGYMEGEVHPANQDRELNRHHRRILQECFETEIPSEVVYDLRGG